MIGTNLLQFTDTTGTGALTLTSAVGYGTIASRFYASSIPIPFGYTVEAITTAGVPTGDWECGVGVLTASNTMSRLKVSASSSGTSKVNFGDGLKRVAVTPSSTVSAFPGFPSSASGPYAGSFCGPSAGLDGGPVATIDNTVIVFAPFCHFMAMPVNGFYVPGTPTGTITAGLYSWGFDGFPGELVLEATAPVTFVASEAREIPAAETVIPPGWYYIALSKSVVTGMSTAERQIGQSVLGCNTAATSYTPNRSLTLPHTYDGTLPQSPSGTYTGVTGFAPAWRLMVAT